jgi:uncharacterized membrane protein
MDPYIADWLNLVFRWIHIIAGAAWIGASFYFNWLNNSIRPPEEATPGIAGNLIAVHGGAFYEVRKYSGAPHKLPKTLHWFKWEAYLTWLSGFLLLLVVYYLNADVYMVDKDVANITANTARIVGISSLVGGWFVYDLLCKTPLVERTTWFALIGFGLMTLSAYTLCNLLGSRAAYIHVGAMMGTMMAGNVFFNIIPNQKLMVDALLAGREPELKKGKEGALRSLHNNYLTLPVLFIMISNHFPMTYGHESNWAVLAALALIGAGTRHYFNLVGQGEKKVWILPVAALAMVALALVTRPVTPEPIPGITANFSEAQAIIHTRCLPCHATEPTHPAFPEPPLGIIYDTPEDIKRYVDKILTVAVYSKTMPLGNLTKMTDEERAKLGAWISAGASLD